MNRKFISLIIAVALIIPLFSYPAYSNGYVKEINGIFDEIQIYIGDKKIPNHKEPFIYEDSVWVSLKDLSRGLGLKYELDKVRKNLKLNSSRKLNINGTNSNKIKAFQRGYEIEAKERIIKDMEGVRFPSSNTRESMVKNIKVGFGNWSIYLDGKKLNLNTSPLFYQNDLYVDILSISPYLYITPSYKEDKSILNIDTNGILVKDGYFSSIDTLLAFREGRNYLLDIQMEHLEEKKALEESLRGIPYGKLKNINDLQDYLNKHFDKVGELSVNIRASETIGNWIYLDIDFPQTSVYRWHGLKRKEVENWIWDMYTAILNLYNEEGLLHGAIRNPRHSRYSSSSNKNYVTFDTKDKDLYFDFSRSLLKKDYRFDSSYLISCLNKCLGKYNKVNFNYELGLSGDDIDLTVYCDSNYVKDWSLYTKMGYLKRLNWEIRRIYPDLAVNGTLVFPNKNIESIDFRLDNNKIKSHDLLRETEVHVNNLYSNFSYGKYSYGLKFNLYEKGMDDLNLIVEGDFSISDDKWAYGEDNVVQRLNTQVQNAISTIITLWDMNVSTEVVDKNNATITELDIYQKNIGIVYADPSEGEIKEGTKVHLYTDTSEADIYYTLDGSTPTQQSNKYTEPIIVSRDVTINAFGYKEGMGAGPVTSLKYTVVTDDNWSYGLKDLKIDKGDLSPSFSRDILDYDVNIDGSTNNITITPYADDSNISINGENVKSGEEKSLLLKEGKNTITVIVKEDNKKEKTYTVNIYRGSSGGADIKIADLNFNTTIVGMFKGRLASNYVDNFNGYKVELLSKPGVRYASVDTDSSGSFEITGFDIDAISKIIGYKCRVYDGTGNLVLEEEL